MKYLPLLFGCCLLLACHSRNRGPVPATRNMDGFMDMLNGKWESTTAAFKKYAVDSLQLNDATSEDLQSPQITDGQVSGKDTTYVMEVNDKAYQYDYRMCWREGKIISIQLKGKKAR